MKVKTVLLTIIGIFLLLIALFFTLTGWFLPEPNYNVGSFPEVIFFEVSKSILNLLIDIIILFIPCYLLSLSMTSWDMIPTFKRCICILVIVSVIGLVITGRSLIESYLLWQPLESSTNFSQQRTFFRGRGGAFGAQKIYTVEFTIKGNNLLIIPNKIIPKLASFGYSANNFGVGIGRKYYVSFIPILSNDVQVQNINEVPLETPLSNLDASSVEFKNKDSKTIHLSIHNYQSNDMIKGSLSFYR